LRSFRESEWTEWRERGEPEQWRRRGASSTVTLQDIVELRAPVTGSMTLLPREKSTERQRVNRAQWAWLWNRGLRDSWQSLADRWQGPWKRSPRSIRGETDPNVFRRYHQMRSLASRAGEARLVEYNLSIGQPIQFGNADGDIAKVFRHHAERGIRGVKRITYARRSNPWRQMMQMHLRVFPGLVPFKSKRLFRPTRQKWPILELDAKYLAQRGAPSLRVVHQRDEPSALSDLISLGLYMCRVLIGIHAWSFRRPDTPIPREPQRLPNVIDGLPVPIVKELDVGRLPDGTPVFVRLTRYCPKRPDGPPIVMIHGYSTSGTTFAHRAVKPNLAQHFYDRNRDVWILDLRTSSGMPTARYPWTFEDVALADLPAAFDYIHRDTGRKLDVVAHCMGAAMFSMAMLASTEPGGKFLQEREALPTRIHRAVLSQVGPVVVMTPGNIFRAYLMNYLGRYFPLGGYDFRVKPDPGLIDRLIDRLLATLPYPQQDFDIENPMWPPWRRTAFVGTRHRMDAIYGRSFNLAGRDGKAQVDRRVLEYIDDLFGPMNLETVSQAIDLTRMQVIASATGRNEYVSIEKLKERWTFPTLSILGEENGLVDIATLARIQAILGDQARCRIRIHRCPGVGHQDSLIGKNAREVFEVISDFLD
jgi:pimeloyl-ACP methyl ester carboxylesterase